jgi:outer membrane lipoprotein
MKIRHLTHPAAAVVGAFLSCTVVAAALTPEQSLDHDLAGPRVAWLGTITRVLPGDDETCFVLNRIEESDLGYYVSTATRFIACNPGSFDEEAFAPGKILLVEGNLGPVMPRRVAGQDITASLVASPNLTAQPDLPERSYPPAYYGSYPYPYRAYDPWYPGWGVGVGLGYHHWRR